MLWRDDHGHAFMDRRHDFAGRSGDDGAGIQGFLFNLPLPPKAQQRQTVDGYADGYGRLFVLSPVFSSV